jgi:hypothetical protein
MISEEIMGCAGCEKSTKNPKLARKYGGLTFLEE